MFAALPTDWTDHRGDSLWPRAQSIEYRPDNGAEQRAAGAQRQRVDDFAGDKKCYGAHDRHLDFFENRAPSRFTLARLSAGTPMADKEVTYGNISNPLWAAMVFLATLAYPER